MGSRSQHSAGKSYGSPMKTEKPGKTTRKRPKAGDKDPSYKKSAPRRNKKRPPNPETKAPEKKKRPPGSPVFRDYRGSEGVIDDATGVTKKKKR